MSNPGSYFIDRLKNGDVRAFEQVFNTHYASLCRHAQKYVIDLDNAREIVQDTFVKLWEIKHSLTRDTSVKSYLYKAVRNNCLDYLKHIRISNEYKEDLLRKIMDSGFRSIASPENCLNGLIEKELEDRINDAIASLPDRCREIFELSRFKGLKYREIAKELNISIKTVETQISRAIQSLHKKLAYYFE
ncbi:RNA polymerase sigma-H factor [subsurface metagenome]